MKSKSYDAAYRDGAFAMREAIKANVQNLQHRILLQRSERADGAMSELEIDDMFAKLFNFMDIRVEGEPDKGDPDEQTGKI